MSLHNEIEFENDNRLRVVRQLRYSAFNENAIDLVLFVNGIPARN